MGATQCAAFVRREEGLQATTGGRQGRHGRARSEDDRRCIRLEGAAQERRPDFRSRLQDAGRGGSVLVRARVFVTLKPSVFDPQGKTIVDALHSLGYGGVEDVRQGKYFELELAAESTDKARSMASEVADKLLANPVIESYRIEIG